MRSRKLKQVVTLFLTAMMFATGASGATMAASRPGSGSGNDAIMAPANDNFASAQLLSGISGDAIATSAAATKEVGEPAHAFNRGGASVWFKFVAPGNGVMRLTTNGSSFDTLLAVYVGSNIASLKLVAANDNLSSELVSSARSRLHFGTQAGTTYYIAVDGKNSSGTAEIGSVDLTFSFDNVMLSNGLANLPDEFWLYSGNRTSTITGSNVGASKESGEPDHAGNAGGKSIWYRWRNNSTYPQTFEFTLDSQALNNLNNPVDSLFAIYAGSNIPSVAGLVPVISSHSSSHRTLLLQAAPQTVYYLAIDGFDAGQGAATGNFTMTYGVAKNERIADFDQDGSADLTVFRPTTGSWYSQDSVTDSLRPYQFGANGDVPLLGDWNHDGKVDYHVFRPDTGTWYFVTTGGLQYSTWGLGSDIPILRRYYFQASKYEERTIFRPSTGTWWMDAGINGYSIQFGQNGDLPVAADFTGDGGDELAVFRPSNGTWYILNMITQQYQTVQFGLNGDKPVVADYDADGRADFAVFRPSNGTWYVLYSSNGSFHAQKWGQNGDRPQPADYDNDGYADFAVFRSGYWYILNSSNGSLRTVQFGLATDIPVTNPLQ
ncbi:MAG: VCBS repeat-containing protein [Pyrinomonadaceae bacterium]